MVEFFSRRCREADNDQLQMFIGISGPLGQFMERRHTEKAMHVAQQRLQHVVASSPAVLFTLAVVDNKILGINWISENLKEVLGYSPEETLGPDWWLEHVHPEDQQEIVSRAQENLLGQENSINEYRFRHLRGHYLWMRSEIRLIRDETGKPVEAVGAWSDISARKLLEDQFRQAQRMEAFGQLAGGVAHDFNNLFTIILGYSEMLMDMMPNDPKRNMLADIQHAGEKAVGLTRQLLAFSRKQVLEPKVCDLNEIVSDIEKMLRRLIGEDVVMTCIFAPIISLVKVDVGQVEQVVMNPAVNARDAMPQGGRLTIETHNVEWDGDYCRVHTEFKPGHYVMLAVTDTGTGMTPEVKARIFEPIFTTKGIGKGTGLGLATVFGIIKQSEGKIIVYSEIGVGTSFKIYLPAAERRKASPSGTNLINKPTPGTETILLVEDEKDVRKLAQLVLETHGYKVLVARDGCEALRIVEAHRAPIHLVVTDVVMPEMSGRELTKALRQRHFDIRVLYMSGYTDDAVVRHGITQAEVAFLQKPYSPLALARKVREVLDEKK